MHEEIKQPEGPQTVEEALQQWLVSKTNTPNSELLEDELVFLEPTEDQKKVDWLLTWSTWWENHWKVAFSEPCQVCVLFAAVHDKVESAFLQTTEAREECYNAFFESVHTMQDKYAVLWLCADDVGLLPRRRQPGWSDMAYCAAWRRLEDAYVAGSQRARPLAEVAFARVLQRPVITMCKRKFKSPLTPSHYDANAAARLADRLLTQYQWGESTALAMKQILAMSACAPFEDDGRLDVWSVKVVLRSGKVITLNIATAHEQQQQQQEQDVWEQLNYLNDEGIGTDKSMRELCWLAQLYCQWFVLN